MSNPSAVQVMLSATIARHVTDEQQVFGLRRRDPACEISIPASSATASIYSATSGCLWNLGVTSSRAPRPAKRRGSAARAPFRFSSPVKLGACLCHENARVPHIPPRAWLERAASQRTCQQTDRARRWLGQVLDRPSHVCRLSTHIMSELLPPPPSRPTASASHLWR